MLQLKPPHDRDKAVVFLHLQKNYTPLQINKRTAQRFFWEDMKYEKKKYHQTIHIWLIRLIPIVTITQCCWIFKQKTTKHAIPVIAALHLPSL